MYKIWIFSFAINIVLFSMLLWNVISVRKCLKRGLSFEIKDKFKNVENLTYMIVALNYTLFVLKLLGNKRFDSEYPEKYNAISYVIVPLIGVLLVFVKHNRSILNKMDTIPITETFLDTNFHLTEITVYILFSFILITNTTLLCVNHKEDVVSSIRSIRSISPL